MRNTKIMQVLMLCRTKRDVLYRKLGKEVRLGIKDMSYKESKKMVISMER